MSMDDPDQTTESNTTSRLSRRTLLGGLLTGGLGLAGYEYVTQNTDPGPVPETHDWEPQTPELATPWFEEVSMEDPHAEYPRPQLVRERWKHLNGVWGFEAVDELADPPTNRELEEGILVPFPVESALSGIAREEDHMWYRRTFELPDDWAIQEGERLILHFEAVDYESRVYVNGEHVDTHTGGYDHFAIDITNALTTARRQELVVGVIDETTEGQPLGKQHPNDGGIWYTPASGIWQSIWLEPVPETHITGLDLTPALGEERLTLTATTNTQTPAVSVDAIAHRSGETIATTTGALGDTLELSIPDPRPWSPRDPFLYDLTVRLRQDSAVIDSVESYFGMRTIGRDQINGRTRMTLNGEVTFALATLDQGYWPDGIYTPPTDDAMIYDLETHHRLGFNTVRKHVKVEPRRWYYHADRLGLVVHQDMPSTADFTGTPTTTQREQFETELRAMIDELKNHPSITTWIPFNEGWGLYDTERIVELVRDWDPTRLINPNSGANIDGGDCGCGDILDVHNYPGPGSIPEPDDRITVLGEFGGLGLRMDGHEWGSGSYSYDSYLTPAGFLEAYTQKLERTRLLAAQCGLSMAVYTQLTDVETENNGLVTYDRKQLKAAPGRIHAVNKRLIDAGTTLTEITTEKPELTGQWPIDPVESERVLDQVGTNHGTRRGETTWREDRGGHVLEFDGGSVETTERGVDTLGSYSVAAWVRLSDDSRSQAAVIQEGDAVNAFRLGYAADRGRLSFEVSDRDTPIRPTRAVATDPANTDTWYHVTGVRDAATSTISLYVNGALAAEGSFCPGFDSQGPLVIGRGYWDSIKTSYWRGYIDDVRIYTGALNSEGVQALYETTHH